MAAADITEFKMSVVTHKASGWSVGTGKPLAILAGLNVLEDEALALEVGTELKRICARLGLPYMFKASWDKANRSSIKSYRGPGIEGLKVLASVKAKLGVPIVTDLHEPHQAEPVAEVADILQLPAFLVRQTDLVIATAEAAAKHGALIQAKKAQFMAPWDAKNILSKIAEVAPDVGVILCERGVSFGYNNLIVDMLAIPEMKKLGAPVTIDATHAVQLPGADPRTGGASRCRNAFSLMSATSSAPKPHVLGASCTITTRPVFFTLSMMVSMSTGQSVRRSITSQSMPCSAALFEASMAS
jgi:2-dehydro-3-deoxyphosphooctonate aldolase (KDO 8-P synthase)